MNPDQMKDASQDAKGQPDTGAEEGKDPLSQLVEGISDGFEKLQQVFQAAGDKIPPEVAKQLQDVASSYDALVQSLSNGPEAPAPEQPARKGQPVPMEGGGSGVPRL